jgi:hypothetical protein
MRFWFDMMFAAPWLANSEYPNPDGQGLDYALVLAMALSATGKEQFSPLESGERSGPQRRERIVSGKFRSAATLASRALKSGPQ